MKLLIALISIGTGILLGAAIQRWGDRDRATYGHKYVPQTDDEVNFA